MTYTGVYRCLRVGGPSASTHPASLVAERRVVSGESVRWRARPQITVRWGLAARYSGAADAWRAIQRGLVCDLVFSDVASEHMLHGTVSAIDRWGPAQLVSCVWRTVWARRGPGRVLLSLRERRGMIYGILKLYRLCDTLEERCHHASLIMAQAPPPKRITPYNSTGSVQYACVAVVQASQRSTEHPHRAPATGGGARS